MDDRWTLKSGSDTLWIESDADPVVSVFIHDDAEGSGICVTHDEACRIALELLRRSRKMPASVLHLVDGCLPPAPKAIG